VGRAGTDLSRDDGLTSLTALNNNADGLGDADLSHGAISDRTSPDHVPPNNDETVSRDLPPIVYSPPPKSVPTFPGGSEPFVAYMRSERSLRG
jgi:hypothetical protein